jgi:hypothetical protein
MRAPGAEQKGMIMLCLRAAFQQLQHYEQGREPIVQMHVEIQISGVPALLAFARVKVTALRRYVISAA